MDDMERILSAAKAQEALLLGAERLLSGQEKSPALRLCLAGLCAAAMLFLPAGSAAQELARCFTL